MRTKIIPFSKVRELLYQRLMKQIKRELDQLEKELLRALKNPRPHQRVESK